MYTPRFARYPFQSPAMSGMDLDPVYTEALTPREFMGVYADQSHDIKSVRVVPPALGERGFGRIVVERRSPVFRRGGRSATLPR
jgi:hypothetical protein